MFKWHPELSEEKLPESTLRLVQIYFATATFEVFLYFHFVIHLFDTATFEDIDRDKKIKFEAQLSLIGGTMGLLTGFSIISGIEIIFFLFRLITWQSLGVTTNYSSFPGWLHPSEPLRQPRISSKIVWCRKLWLSLHCATEKHVVVDTLFMFWLCFLV